MCEVVRLCAQLLRPEEDIWCPAPSVSTHSSKAGAVVEPGSQQALVILSPPSTVLGLEEGGGVFFSLSDGRWQFELSSQYSEVCPLVDSRCDLVDNQDSHRRCLSSGSVCITGRALLPVGSSHCSQMSRRLEG